MTGSLREVSLLLSKYITRGIYIASIEYLCGQAAHYIKEPFQDMYSSYASENGVQYEITALIIFQCAKCFMHPSVSINVYNVYLLSLRGSLSVKPALLERTNTVA